MKYPSILVWWRRPPCWFLARRNSRKFTQLESLKLKISPRASPFTQTSRIISTTKYSCLHVWIFFYLPLIVDRSRCHILAVGTGTGHRRALRTEGCRLTSTRETLLLCQLLLSADSKYRITHHMCHVPILVMHAATRHACIVDRYLHVHAHHCRRFWSLRTT